LAGRNPRAATARPVPHRQRRLGPAQKPELANKFSTACPERFRWFEVDSRGHINTDKVAHWRVTLKIGLTLQN
jgi:hypothetical protein